MTAPIPEPCVCGSLCDPFDDCDCACHVAPATVTNARLARLQKLLET